MKKMIFAGVAALTPVGTASAQQPQVPVGDITRAAAIADAERGFAALDMNGNGTLEAAEMQKASEQRRADRRQRMEARIAQMSAEDRARMEQWRAERGDGEARQGRREWSGGSDRRSAGGPTTLAEFRAQAEQRFDRLDLDRNGVITAAEQAQLRAQREGRGE